MERITTTKSKMFQPMVKQQYLREISFSTNSPVNRTMNTRLIRDKTRVIYLLWSSVSTIMVTMFKQMRIIMLISKTCLVTKSKTIPWNLFQKKRGGSYAYFINTNLVKLQTKFFHIWHEMCTLLALSPKSSVYSISLHV